MDHPVMTKWVPSNGGVVCEPSRQPLLFILVAFFIYFKDRRFQGEFVRNSIYIWPGNGKVHLPNRNRGVKAKEEARLWKVLPEFIRSKGIIVNQSGDYHGHFIAELFEGLFEEMCTNLVNMGLPLRNIYMGGASYHHRKLDQKTTSNDNKLAHTDWLKHLNYALPTGQGNHDPENPTTDQL
ncbi:hypothetical protein BGZ83_003343 [Gryganskiella cystojenkinii]|nr:hypothetical protein BGZ83_003343 [Gryganskiella cystojenkinii]